MKPTLLLLPGLGADEALFRYQIDHLQDIVNPLCVDYRDCATRTEMAEAALRATSGPFALAGMSLGGWVAQEVVHLAPHRVLKLALLNTWARPQAPAMAALEHQNDMPRLRGVACPTIVIHGRQDGVFSLAEHEAIAGAIPMAKLVVIEECGHESPLEQPQAVTTLLRDWLLNEQGSDPSLLTRPPRARRDVPCSRGQSSRYWSAVHDNPPSTVKTEPVMYEEACDARSRSGPSNSCSSAKRLRGTVHTAS